jgi:transposase
LGAAQVGNHDLTRMAKRLIRHFDQVVARYDHEISTGPLKGINQKIKELQRRAYGFRDDEFFRLLVPLLHENERRLIGA